MRLNYAKCNRMQNVKFLQNLSDFMKVSFCIIVSKRVFKHKKVSRINRLSVTMNDILGRYIKVTLLAFKKKGKNKYIFQERFCPIFAFHIWNGLKQFYMYFITVDLLDTRFIYLVQGVPIVPITTILF